MGRARRAKEKRRGQAKRRFYDELACVNERIELLPRLRFDLSSPSSCDETSSPSASTGRRAGSVGPIYDNESRDLSPASRYDEILSGASAKLELAQASHVAALSLVSAASSPSRRHLRYIRRIFISRFAGRD